MKPGQRLLRALKDSTLAGKPALVLPVGTPVRALLRPIATVADATDPTDVRLLSEWRNRHVASFLTEFVSHQTRNDIRRNASRKWDDDLDRFDRELLRISNCIQREEDYG